VELYQRGFYKQKNLHPESIPMMSFAKVCLTGAPGIC
jgi:hypothetical protein